MVGRTASCAVQEAAPRTALAAIGAIGIIGARGTAGSGRDPSVVGSASPPPADPVALPHCPTAVDRVLGDGLVICPRLRFRDEVVSTATMVARFGATREVTLDDLRVELIFPADETARAFFERQRTG